MPDPVSTTANVLGLFNRIIESVSLIRNRFRRKPVNPLFPGYVVKRYDFELQPVSIYVDLLTNIPYVELRFYAINYLNRQLRLNSGEATHVNCGQHIERVPIYQDYDLAPRSTSLVFFRRNLLDSEVRSISALQNHMRLNSSYNLTAKAKLGRREYNFGPVSTVPIEGWVNMKQPDKK